MSYQWRFSLKVGLILSAIMIVGALCMIAALCLICFRSTDAPSSTSIKLPGAELTFLLDDLGVRVRRTTADLPTLGSEDSIRRSEKPTTADNVPLDGASDRKQSARDRIVAALNAGESCTRRLFRNQMHWIAQPYNMQYRFHWVEEEEKGCIPGCRLVKWGSGELQREVQHR